MIGHLLLALAIQGAVAGILRNLWAGAFAASAWAISREITQAEYRWIEQFGGGLRANMPWWGGLDLRVWQTTDQWADWALPTMLVVVIAGRAQLRRRPPSATIEAT